MISQCPHCRQALNLNEAQQAKIQTALAGLQKGTLKMGCPHCKKAIHLQADGSCADTPRESGPGSAANSRSVVKPPRYPDISWMANDMYEEMAAAPDVDKALVMMPEGAVREAVSKAFLEQGCQAEFPESASDAIARMRFTDFTYVVLHTGFAGPPAESEFHQYLSNMPMARRRAIYYILMGPEFHTLYDLEALANNANLVVNDNEAACLEIVFRKGRQDYDDLFGPYLEAMEK
ncbi:hypothetical protein ACOHYD_10530 [Desulfobacterota bacterium M19]